MATKYHNCKTIVSGIQFASRKEATRYQELLWMQQAGDIENLELQPRFDIIVNGAHICYYYADFRYKDVVTGLTITEDVKSKATRTSTYVLKKKLVKALYDVDIVEV